MNLRFVGFFKELHARARHDLPRAKELVGSLDEQDARSVLKYLAGGVPFMDAALTQHDPIDSRLIIPGGMTLVSDGIWVWPDDLRYLVERYRIGLARDFVERCAGGRALNSDERAFIVRRGPLLDQALQAWLSSSGSEHDYAS